MTEQKQITNDWQYVDAMTEELAVAQFFNLKQEDTVVERVLFGLSGNPSTWRIKRCTQGDTQ